MGSHFRVGAVTWWYLAQGFGVCCEDPFSTMCLRTPPQEITITIKIKITITITRTIIMMIIIIVINVPCITLIRKVCVLLLGVLKQFAVLRLRGQGTEEEAPDVIKHHAKSSKAFEIPGARLFGAFGF